MSFAKEVKPVFPNQGGINKLAGGASPLALYNIETLINKFTKQCICFNNFFYSQGGLKQRTST